jgi:hypothetical protein
MKIELKDTEELRNLLISSVNDGKIVEDKFRIFKKHSSEVMTFIVVSELAESHQYICGVTKK